MTYSVPVPLLICFYFQYKLGLTLMRLSFNLNTWMECGGDNTLSATEAGEQAKEYIEQAINIFKDVSISSSDYLPLLPLFVT